MAKKWTVSTLEQVAAFFGKSYQTVRRSWSNNGMPGEKGAYPLDQIARWRIDVAEAVASRSSASSDDGDSLDKLRRTQAALKALELQEKRNALIDRDRVHISLVRLASLLRSAGDRLQAEYGADAQSILDEALDDFERLVEEEFGE